MPPLVKNDKKGWGSNVPMELLVVFVVLRSGLETALRLCSLLQATQRTYHTGLKAPRPGYVSSGDAARPIAV